MYKILSPPDLEYPHLCMKHFFLLKNNVLVKVYDNAHHSALQKGWGGQVWKESVIFPHFFKTSTVNHAWVPTAFKKVCEMDQNDNGTIPGIYRSGALISYRGATGSDLLYWTDQF